MLVLKIKHAKQFEFRNRNILSTNYYGILTLTENTLQKFAKNFLLIQSAFKNTVEPITTISTVRNHIL